MIVLVQKNFLYTFVLFLAAGIVLCLALPPRSVPAGLGGAEKPQPTYVIDAGHGGEDGGAVGADGTVESAINLAVAKRVEALLSFVGANTAMTREDENAIYDKDAETLREKKRSDLKNRVTIVNDTPNAVLISIHQNALPSVPAVHGAQVFYSPTMGSRELAHSIQMVLNKAINTNNAKEEKRIEPSIYLMNEAACPAALVECGFLSNVEETRQLVTTAHQTRLAVAVTAGILQADTNCKR